MFCWDWSLIVRYKEKFQSLPSIYLFVMKFVSDFMQVGGFRRFPPPIKLTGTI
jgi:hypothetical protein